MSAVTEAHGRKLPKDQRQVLLSRRRAGCTQWEDPTCKTLPGSLVTYQVKNMDLTPGGPGWVLGQCLAMWFWTKDMIPVALLFPLGK